MRKWSVRHSKGLEFFYIKFEKAFLKLNKLWSLIGIDRLEKPAQLLEKSIKGLMFDCQMCGKCALGSTGMSCPMNCPKTLRNGPCGGVRLNGNCEINEDMACVWVEAWNGSQQMQQAEKIKKNQAPVNNLLKDTSSWLRVLREEGQDSPELIADVRIKR